MKHFEAIDFDDYTEFDQIDRAEVFLGSLGMQLGEGNSGCILPAGFRGNSCEEKIHEYRLLPFATTRVISDNIKKWADKARVFNGKQHLQAHVYFIRLSSFYVVVILKSYSRQLAIVKEQQLQLGTT